MKLSNKQVKELQRALADIIQNIDANMSIVNDDEINETFIVPLLMLATEISDKVFTQTQDTINDVSL